ncbi:hypothetical protein J6K68_11660, partial [Leuconostoc mesenteroides]|nr:hypothetical protein [Leuconostoc mesenteroides]
DVRAMHPLSAARLVQALFDALALPEFAVSPDEIVEFAMTALLSDPDRLAEIRARGEHHYNNCSYMLNHITLLFMIHIH